MLTEGWLVCLRLVVVKVTVIVTNFIRETDQRDSIEDFFDSIHLILFHSMNYM
ncbi:hypothetical protein BH20ACI3_BH20ACI3_05690 [soil metagenome]